MRLRLGKSFCGFWVLGLAFLPAAHSEATRVTNPNAFDVEFLGRGLLYSVNYDRVLNDDLVAGLGYGSVGLQTVGGVDTGTHVGLLPMYLNYYFLRDAGSIYATVGATLVTNSSDAQGLKSNTGNVEFNSNSVLPTFGLGYENRGDAGFLIRIAAYGIYAKSLVPWGGFTFGYAF